MIFSLLPFLADDLPWPKEHELVSWIVCAAAVMLIVERGIALVSHFRGGDAVPQADFVTHKADIWKVVNGLRAAVSRIELSVATIATLREANGHRLEEVVAQLDGVKSKFDHMAGAVEQFMKEGHRK